MSHSEREDANQVAARVVRESTHSDALPADLEAAWQAWSAGVGKVDTRTMALLRAAFEAGAEAATGMAGNDGRNPAAVALNKLGASKGGKSRAAKLSETKRKEIASKAAAKRWAK